jgi:cytochrome P450
MDLDWPQGPHDQVLAASGRAGENRQAGSIGRTGNLEARFDPFDPGIFDDPYPIYARLRAHAPPYRGARHLFWTLSPLEDIKAALADHETFSSDAARGGIGITPGEAGEAPLAAESHAFPPGNLILMDPPRHTAFRKVVTPRFLHKGMSHLEPVVRDVVGGLIDGFCEAGEVDIVPSFASAVPALVFADVLGVPRSRGPELQRWAAELTRVPTTVEAGEIHQRAVASVRALFRDLLAFKKANPEDDLLTDMALATGPGKTFGEDDFVGMAVSMMIAGNETTANLLASALCLLAKHPDQRAELVRGEVSIESAVEECLRFEPPVHGLARVLTRDIELYGQPLHEGEKVLLLYASGNRDERVFDDPERFDVRREIDFHLSFGFGVHFCVGSRLGRLEMRTALRTFLERIPEYAVPLDQIHWSHIFATRQMESLPISFEPSARRGGLTGGSP